MHKKKTSQGERNIRGRMLSLDFRGVGVVFIHLFPEGDSAIIFFKEETEC